MHRTVWLFVLLFAVALVPAMADTTFDFSFIPTAGTDLSASGTLLGHPNGDGTYTAVSGTGTITYGTNTYAMSLFANPTPPGTSQAYGFTYESGNYTFTFDDQLFPSSPVSPVDTWGLLFSTTGAPSAATAVNIYNNTQDPGGDQAFLIYSNDVENGTLVLSQVSSVPEPGALSLLFTMLAGVGGLAGVLRKKLS
jgi:hypothetical protein